jgi:hypothetical protein
MARSAELAMSWDEWGKHDAVALAALVRKRASRPGRWSARLPGPSSCAGQVLHLLVPSELTSSSPVLKTPSGGQVVDRSALIMPRSNRSPP